MRIGSLTPIAFYVGSAQVDRLYLGATLIWSAAQGWAFDDGDLVVSMPSGPRWAFEDGDLVTAMPGAT